MAHENFVRIRTRELKKHGVFSEAEIGTMVFRDWNYMDKDTKNVWSLVDEEDSQTTQLKQKISDLEEEVKSLKETNTQTYWRALYYERTLCDISNAYPALRGVDKVGYPGLFRQ
jgi:hypothetical protein